MIIAIFVLGIFLYLTSVVCLIADTKSFTPVVFAPLSIAVSTVSAWAIAPLCGAIFLISELILVVLIVYLLIRKSY